MSYSAKLQGTSEMPPISSTIFGTIVEMAVTMEACSHIDRQTRARERR